MTYAITRFQTSFDSLRHGMSNAGGSLRSALSGKTFLVQSNLTPGFVWGRICTACQCKISWDVELLAGTRPSDIPQESRYLLEIPRQLLHSSLPVHKADWVLAMKATKTSFRRKEADLTSQGTRARKRERQPSCNLLEGVQESLYGRLFLRAQATKQTLAEAQTFALARIKHQ